jgi:diguanylate cyclase (GGDEF)-like protein
VALVGPLAALVLYRRSAARGQAAMRLALIDPLTGLGNQRRFHRRVDEEVAHAAAAGAGLSLLLFDVDDFKRINDRLGHGAGDRVLQEVAACLKRVGEAFRLGGDEFAVLLPDSGQRPAGETQDAVVAHAGGVEVDGVGAVSMSAGTATFPRDGSGRQELIERADARLYGSKRRRRRKLDPPGDSLAAAGNGQ